jgi:hypothetical protein
MKKQMTLMGTMILTVTLFVGCGKSNSDAGSDSASEVAAGNIAGIANATEGSGTLAAFNVPQAAVEKIQAFLNPIPEAFADGQCPTWATTSCDSNGNLVLTFTNCHRGLSVWNGSETLAFSSRAVCDARTNGDVPLSGSVDRTFGDPTTRTLGNIQVSFDTTSLSGYQTQVAGGVHVDFGQDASGDPQRTVDIKGIHEVATNVSQNSTRWDHTFYSDPANPMVIVKSGAKKTIPSGNFTLEHNLAKWTAAVTVKSTLSFSADCCHPTGGSIESDYTGSKTQSETLTFKSTCGEATLTAADGSSVDVLLKHCF